MKKKVKKGSEKRFKKGIIFGFFLSFFSFIFFKEYVKEYIDVCLFPKTLLAGSDTKVESTNASLSEPSKKVEILKEAVPLKQAFSEEDRQEIIKIVKTVIQENPDLIADSVQKAMQNQQDKARLHMEDLASQNLTQLMNSGVFFGDRKALSRFIIFLDPLCPHCQEFEKVLLEVENVALKHKISFTIYPVGLFGENSAILARFLIAAAKESPLKMLKFALEISKLPKNKLDLVKINKAAHSCGLNIKNLEHHLSSNETNHILELNTSMAEKIQIPGVPAIFGIHKDNKASILPPSNLQTFLEMSVLLTYSKAQAIEIEQKKLNLNQKQGQEKVPSQTLTDSQTANIQVQPSQDASELEKVKQAQEPLPR
jgi:protein-disulfide isomerase